MSKVRQDMIWQHNLVLPYILGDLKAKIEKICAVEKILLYGSRARIPFKDWEQLVGKDWDILVIAKFPIVNTNIWTTACNYHVDLHVIDAAMAKIILQHPRAIKELYPNNELMIN